MPSKTKMIASKNKRLDYLDIFRALGIILMIMGHIGFGKRFSVFIHAFNMPMFFLISGFLFKANVTFKDFLLKKGYSLILPYFSFGLINYCFWIWFNGFSWDPLLALLSFKNSKGFPIAGALWFLSTLFFSELSYYIIYKLVKNNRVRHLCVILFVLVGCTIRKWFPISVNYVLGPSLVAVGFLHFGFVFKNRCDLSRMVNKTTLGNWIICFVILTFMIFYNGSVNMRTSTYQLIPLFLLNALVGTYCGLIIAHYIELLTQKSDYLYRWLVQIGKYSITFVCLNQLVIKIIKTYLNYSNQLIDRMIVLIITLAVLNVINVFFVKCRIGKYFGIKNK